MLAGVGGCFISFVKSYSRCFASYIHGVSDNERQYASGLMQAGSRKNMDRMSEIVTDVRSRNLQQSITHSKLDARQVMDHVAQDTDDFLGDVDNACLFIDESSLKNRDACRLVQHGNGCAALAKLIIKI